MGDWEFLHDMKNEGYSTEEILDAAAVGYSPSEWQYIDRDWVDDQLDKEPEEESHSIVPFKSRDGVPFSILKQSEIFYDLIDCAERHFENTGRYLQIWGELGEIYAEIKHGLRRHGTHTAGSDGTLDGKLVEVKTISPEKTNDRVTVKSAGDFEQLLIVRINKDFQIQSKLFNRNELNGLNGKFLTGKLKSDSEI